jgi:uncharacterized damage-inducible protein DinB
MSKVEFIRSMFGHNEWANDRILETASSLSEVQLAEQSELCPKGITDTLGHAVSTQIFWLAEWEKEGSFEMSMIQGISGLDAIKSRSAESHAALGKFIDGLGEEGCERTIRPPEWWGDTPGLKIPLWHVMMQVVMHSMQHRAEVAQALTAAGESPGEMDYIGWAIERNKVDWVK